MIRSVEFGLKTESEPNLRFASKGGMFAKATRTKKQRKATREALDRLRMPFLPWITPEGAAPSYTLPNRVEVRCTRLGPGRLDEHDNLPVSFKGVVDEIAAWCGLRDNDPRFRVLPAQQERTPNGSPWRVRIELIDLDPRPSPPPLVLASVDHPKPAKPKPNGTKKAAPSITLGPGGDDEKSPRQLKPCPRAGCWAALDMPCKLLPGDLVVCGVHAERAQAAGVEGIALPHPRPSEANGVRKAVPSGPRPVPVFVALPWKQKRCAECFVGGFFGVSADPRCAVCERLGRAESLTLEPRVDGRSAPRCLRYRVPGEHVARWGVEVVVWPAREPVGGVDAVVFREGKRG